MNALSASLFITPADSARAAAQAYTASLLTCIPLAIALACAWAWRSSPAGRRALVWKSAAIALLVICLGRFTPSSWFAWSVPAGLAAPLIVFGRLQLTASAATAPDGSIGEFLRAAWVVYWAGVFAFAVPLVRALIAGVTASRRGRPLSDPSWLQLLAECRAALGVRRGVRLLVSAERVAPQTWGIIRPIILLPPDALTWTATQRRAVLLHELAHVRQGDVVMIGLARAACALLWFHPGSWWVWRRLRAECEVACDDQVLAAGVRASDYADVLLALTPSGGTLLQPAGVALSAHGAGLRHRLAAIVEPRARGHAPSARATAVACCTSLILAMPLSAVRLAPSRDTLTTLLRDSRWESRAYAGIGLAQRRDSLDVARETAQRDPNPRVRAWVRFALMQSRGRDLPAILAERR